MKNFHPKTYKYVRYQGGENLIRDGITLDNSVREILDLSADQINIYSYESPLVYIPNGNYTGEQKIIHVIGQVPENIHVMSEIQISTFIGESLYFDNGQAGIPGEAGMTEVPSATITMRPGTIAYLRWVTDRWIIASASRFGRNIGVDLFKGPAVYYS